MSSCVGLTNEFNKYTQMKKAEFIKKFSKIEDTFEDEFRAEFNSPELIWEALKEQLLIQRVGSSYSEKQVEDAYDKGFKDAMVKYRE